MFSYLWIDIGIDRSSRPEVFLGKGVLKICSKFTGEHPCRSVISIKLQSNFTEIALRHGCSSVNLLHILRTPFLKNTSGRLLLDRAKMRPGTAKPKKWEWNCFENYRICEIVGYVPEFLDAVCTGEPRNVLYLPDLCLQKEVANYMDSHQKLCFIILDYIYYL